MTGDQKWQPANSLNSHFLLPVRTLCPQLDDLIKIATSRSSPFRWGGKLLAVCSHDTWYLTHLGIHHSEPFLCTSVYVFLCVLVVCVHVGCRGQHQLSPTLYLETASPVGQELSKYLGWLAMGPKDLPACLRVPSTGVTSVCHYARLFRTLNLKCHFMW